MGKDFKKVVLCGILLMSAVRVCACDVPVFKYALNMWPPDAYECVVVHRGGEDASHLLEQLRKDAGGLINMAVREAAPEVVQKKYGVLLDEGLSGGLPWLIVRYPVRMDTRGLVWAGPVSASEVGIWTDSPIRRKIKRLLLDRSAGVWVFLESGDSAKDEVAYKCLERELSRLERVMRLSNELGSESGVTFKILRLSRHDPAEKALLLMLTKSEPDLESLYAEPMVFPVYGRGLMLYALVGAGINAVTITETAEFLAGECSCEIKSQNPGMELLMSADWEGDNSVSAGLADFSERADQTAELLDAVAVMPADTVVGEAVEKEKDSGALFVKLSVAVLLFVLSAAMILMFVLWRRRRM